MFLISERNFNWRLSNVSFVCSLRPQEDIKAICYCRMSQKLSRTCVIKLNDKFLHFLVSDSLCFATSQLCDLSNPDHVTDIAKILAFLIADR
jgi:hypothetical protein